MATSQNATKPDEDDLDDLDDVLEDFKQASLPATPARAASPPPLPPASALPPPGQDDQLDDDFLRDLQKEMEAILGPLPTQVEGMEGDEETKAMQAMFQRLMQEAADAGPPPGITEGAGGVGEAKGKERSTGPSAAAPPAAGVGDEDFQETIRRTMAKMKESGEGVKAGLDANDSDPMAAMLAALAGGSGGQSEEDLRTALEGMMEQLMSKELLEEPLQALAEKYPDWIAAKRSTLPPAELARYERQYGAIDSLLSIFHASSYSADDPATSKRVMDLMQTMQECGAPPKEIMGDLPEGMDFGEDGMPSMDNCTIS